MRIKLFEGVPMPLARAVRLDADQILDRLTFMAKQLPDEVADAARRATREGLNTGIIRQLADRIIGRARTCEQVISAGAADRTM